MSRLSPSKISLGNLNRAHSGLLHRSTNQIVVFLLPVLCLSVSVAACLCAQQVCTGKVLFNQCGLGRFCFSCIHWQISLCLESVTCFIDWTNGRHILRHPPKPCHIPAVRHLKAEGSVPNQGSNLYVHHLKAESSVPNQGSNLYVHHLKAEGSVSNQGSNLYVHHLKAEGSVPNQGSNIYVHRLKAEGSVSNQGSNLYVHHPKAEGSVPNQGTNLYVQR
ncbi:hypothetical protein RRG08_015455 [Elysia crispata]|uniref:Uncharacterized protein n=1 Tax=Elysia crispata TaxID=231223 RepID=A0AAE1CZB6_9GAST|nr:hypothetical protein RRG08_015455 [Elysia crispata]